MCRVNGATERVGRPRECVPARAQWPPRTRYPYVAQVNVQSQTVELPRKAASVDEEIAEDSPDVVATGLHNKDGLVHLRSGVQRNTTRNKNLLSHTYTSQLR